MPDPSSQPRDRSRHMGLHRAQRNARRAGDLRVAHPLHVGQNDAQALGRAQLGQHPIEIDSIARVRCWNLEGEIGSVILDRFFEPSAAAGMLQPYIDGDSVQPWTEGAGVT